jgi:hypothetical protein
MSLAYRCPADTRCVEPALQAFKHDFSIYVVAGSPRFVSGAQTTRNELCLDAAPLDARTNRCLDKLGKGLAIRQHGLDLGAEAWFYTNRRDGGGFHQPTVSQMRCNL